MLLIIQSQMHQPPAGTEMTFLLAGQIRSCNGMGPKQRGTQPRKTYGALHKGAETDRAARRGSFSRSR